MATTVEVLLARAHESLAEAPEVSRREIVLLLAQVLELGEAQILARGERPVPRHAADRFEALLQRRVAGEPFAYLVGEREFYRRPFSVDPRVLIPRPETEHLVDRALALELPPAPRVLDVGTGSGCLAITLALELDGRAVGTDLSPGALAVARGNTIRHAAEHRVDLVGADLAASLRLERFDLVVANPPYVEPGEETEISREILDHEPRSALFSPGGGRAIYSRLFADLAGLAAGTPVLAEIGAGQAALVAELLQESPLELVAIRPDYAGRDRVLEARRR